MEKGVVADFAKGAGKPGALKAICANWELTEAEAISIRTRNTDKINELRPALANACFELAAHTAGEIAKDLANPEKMAETPLHHKAQALEKLTNAGVTAQDGHKPQVSINFGDIRAGRDLLAERDRKMKQAKAVEV